MKPKAKPNRKVSRAAWARIRLFAMDVDGVLTDGSVYTSSDGTETKRFSVLDGLGLAMVRDAGFIIAWISGRESRTTALRAKELKVPYVIQGRHDKLAVLKEVAAGAGVALDQCVYMGDDLLDVTALRAAGIGVTVPNAMPAALSAADHRTRRVGGSGAVREICDLLLSAHAGAPRNSPVPPRTQ